MSSAFEACGIPAMPAVPMPSPDPLPCDDTVNSPFQTDSAGYLMNRIARQFAQLLGERLRPLGLMPAQFPILLALWQRDGQSQHELVAGANLRQATIANTLARMERDGLIRRVPNPADARSRLITLTERSRQLQEAATDIALGINQEALSALDDTEREHFVEAMQRIVTRQQQMLDGKPVSSHPDVPPLPSGSHPPPS